MGINALWPLLLAVVMAAIGVSAIVERRFYLFQGRDPEAAIYRDDEPGFYWALVTATFVIVGVLLFSAYRSL